jgi:hypothetical protein
MWDYKLCINKTKMLDNRSNFYSAVLVQQPSQAVAPLLLSLRGSGDSPCHIGIQKLGTYIYKASYTQHTGLLGSLLHEILQLLMG